MISRALNNSVESAWAGEMFDQPFPVTIEQLIIVPVERFSPTTVTPENQHAISFVSLAIVIEVAGLFYDDTLNYHGISKFCGPLNHH